TSPAITRPSRSLFGAIRVSRAGVLHEQHVERRRPGLAAVLRYHRRFAHALAFGSPGDALVGRPAVLEMHLAFQDQRATLEVAVDHHDGTSVGDPGLLPLLPDGVVAEDAVADESIDLFIELVHCTAAGNRFHVGAGYGGGGALRVG